LRDSERAREEECKREGTGTKKYHALVSSTALNPIRSYAKHVIGYILIGTTPRVEALVFAS